jgi:hypothetical protein
MFHIPETLYLRSISATLTIMQFCGLNGVIQMYKRGAPWPDAG